MEKQTLKLFFECIDPKSGLMKIEPICAAFGLCIDKEHDTIASDELLYDLFESGECRWGYHDQNTNQLYLSKEAFIRWCMMVEIQDTSEELRDELIHLLMFDALAFIFDYHGEFHLIAMKKELLKENPKFIEYLRAEAAYEDAKKRSDTDFEKLRDKIEADIQEISNKLKTVMIK